MTKVCPNCGFANPLGTAFCGSCARFLAWDPAAGSAPPGTPPDVWRSDLVCILPRPPFPPDEQEAGRWCPTCGHWITGLRRFCPSCGYDAKETMSTGGPPPPVRAPAGIALTVEPRQLFIEPGQEASVLLRVRNTGVLVDRVYLSATGPAAAWGTLSPSIVNLFPGSETTATLTFAPPRYASARAGSVAFSVRAASTEDPDRVVTEEGTLTIAPVRAVN
jgi:hypothetical protein